MAEKAQIGLDSFYYCECTADSSAAATYGSPVAITGIISASVKANSSIESQWADDGPADNVASIGGPEITLSFTNLSPATRAALLGHTVTSGVIEEKVTDIPKTVAIGFRSQKSNGKYRYVWFLKGNFSKPDDNYATKEASVKFGTTSLAFKGLRREYDKKISAWCDEDDTAVAAATITAWFNAVPVTIASPSALTITPVPADGASGIGATADCTFTFNNAIKPAYVTSEYFYLLNVDGTVVANALSIDTANKVVTLNPTESLSGTTDYILVASGLVQDIYGQTVAAGKTVVNFTTT